MNTISSITSGAEVPLGAICGDPSFPQLRFPGYMGESQWFRLMIQAAPVMIWATDREGRLLFGNRFFEAFFNLDRNELDKPDVWVRLIHPEHISAFSDAFRTGAACHREFRILARVLRADGEWRWIEAQAAPWHLESGEFMGFVGCSPDVTESVERAREQLEQGRLKDDFMAVLAHELRNPLAPIAIAAEVIRVTGAGMSASAEAALDVITRQLRQLTRLVSDIADVPAISSGRMTLRRSTFCLQDCLAAAVETCRQKVDQRQQKLHIRLPRHPVLFSGDESRLCQVFSNLLNNASKFTPDKGGIFLTMEVNEEVEVSVRDEGIGIGPGERDRIFELFVQSESAKQASPDGLGIGLSVAKKLVQLHGGRIRVISEGPGRGSEFIAVLPRAAS